MNVTGVKSRWVRPCVLTFAILVLTAQTPAPKPLRHLEYTFKLHQEGLVGQESQGSEAGATMGNTLAGTGGSGTMSVDVLSFASDGALVVRIAAWVKLEPRARQAYTCTVYGNTTVICPAVPAPSQAEWVLLSYLGRQFVDGAPWDAQHQWKRSEHTDRFDLAEDFTLAAGSNENRAAIHESKLVSIHNGGYSKQNEDVTINYDRAMEVPDFIHDDFTAAADDGQDTGHATFDFQLVKDSYAKS